MEGFAASARAASGALPAAGRRLGGGPGRRHGTRWHDEAEALAVQGADEALALAVVPERLARGLHAARDRRVRHHPAVPDLLDDLVARDEAVPVLDQ